MNTTHLVLGGLAVLAIVTLLQLIVTKVEAINARRDAAERANRRAYIADLDQRIQRKSR